jgi:hypothetical protein
MLFSYVTTYERKNGLLLIEVFSKFFNTQNDGRLDQFRAANLFIRVSNNHVFRSIWNALIIAGGIIVIRPPHQPLITFPATQFLNIRVFKNLAFLPRWHPLINLRG